MSEFKVSSLSDAQIEQLKMMEQQLERETNEPVVLVAYTKDENANDSE